MINIILSPILNVFKNIVKNVIILMLYIYNWVNIAYYTNLKIILAEINYYYKYLPKV